MIRTAPASRQLFLGLFLLLAAVGCVLAPIPLLYRSLGILAAAYLGFSVAGMPAAYLIGLVVPVVGLAAGVEGWLVMLPLVLASNLLALLGLSYAWRLPAIVVSPLLAAAPLAVARALSRRELFRVELPWEPAPGAWVALHALVAAAGVLVAVLVERFRTRGEVDGA